MVGQEMLTDPKLLCCDEPTSGLDSTTACVVVEALPRCGTQRRARPAHDIFADLFSQIRSLLIMSNVS